MGRFLNPLLAIDILQKSGVKIFSLNDFCGIFGVSKIAAQKFTENYTKRGLFVRLKKGLFYLKNNTPPDFLLANKLYEPSYVSLDSALSFYGIIPETIYQVTSVTSKATRQFEIEGNIYLYRRIKMQAFTGYIPINYQNTTVYMAEPEKALADYLYFVYLKKRFLDYERLDFSKIKKKKLEHYIKIYNCPKMYNFLKEIYANKRND